MVMANKATPLNYTNIFNALAICHCSFEIPKNTWDAENEKDKHEPFKHVFI